MQHQKKVFIIMQDRFLLELYKTIFRIRGYQVVDTLEEDELMPGLQSTMPHLIVVEKVLASDTCNALIRFINQEKIPILVLTKPEDACNIEKSIQPELYGYGDILNENIGDIVRRGEKMAEKWQV